MKLLSKIVAYFKWKTKKIVKPAFIFVEKRKFSKCGKNLDIYGKPRISFPERITLGDNVSLNDGCVLNATLSAIKIGNNVTISADAKILAATYDVKEFLQKHNTHHINKPIIIGDNVWICSGAIICPGVHILGGVIVAAGAIVTKDVEEKNVIVAGNPGRIVKHLDLSD